MNAVQRRWVLTGGIGSGKSTVRSMLEELGVATIDADSVGHEVLEPGGPAFRDVSNRWPSVVVAGRIDRRRLGEIVFGDAGALVELEQITHPHIFGTILRRLEVFEGGTVVVEVPLIRHGLGSNWGLIVVDTDDDTRQRRLLKRGMAPRVVESRMASQPSRGEWLSSCDVVIPNHGTADKLMRTVETLLPVL